MILEAFAERPAIPNSCVDAGREVSTNVGSDVGSSNAIGVTALEKNEEPPPDGG